KLDGSKVASGLILQNSNASPIFGFTARPCLAQSDNSFQYGRELKFPLAEGNTVSPPSSTSDLHQQQQDATIKHQHQNTMRNILDKLDFLSRFIKHEKRLNVILQIHQKSGNPLASIFCVELIEEVIKMCVILLPNFIVENLKSFTML
ncbi:hypothetical protein TorRG33x02_103520, partial [Trema orientale]